MTAVLMRTFICVATLVATLITLLLVASMSPRTRCSRVRVLMFSSLQEAKRAWAQAALESPESSSITEPRYVAEIRRYFIVIEDMSRDFGHSDSVQLPEPGRKLRMDRRPRRFSGNV